MKKFILSITFLVASVAFINAQEANSIRLSFVAEPQFSWLKPDIDGVESRGSKGGYNFGVVLDRFFADNYAFSTGLTINTTGGKLRYTTPGGLPEGEVLPDGAPQGDKEYKLRYIEIPLGLKLRSNDFRRSNFYGRFGLTPQINIEARDGDDNSISDEINIFDLGYHLGAGIEYSIGGTNALMFGLVYHNGFTDITDEPGYDDKTVLNRLVFEIGFIF
ncbi:porin family protein [Marinilabilia rubra]|uniref:PorT family protein n=1 Tax=Marinilabilia rubra TaxID=2162893 RepID=A0A2U2B8B7_9BACT|nr:porin family protein [Marinilabilia rubra]PWD99309.1 PorT family protein [Marinilabilia rubra]